MSPEQLTDHGNVIGIIHARQYDGQIPGNSLRPQAGNVQRRAAQRIRGRPQGRIHIQDIVGKALEENRFFRSDAQMVQLHLRLSPGEGDGSLKGPAVAIFVSEVHGLLSSFSRHRGKN